jgi:hypothetical protein
MTNDEPASDSQKTPGRQNGAPSNLPNNSQYPAIIDQRWFVFVAIFLVMMFLGLPLLWRCPAFSRAEKIIWTIVTLVYSVVVFWIFVLVMMWSWGNISKALWG